MVFLTNSELELYQIIITQTQQKSALQLIELSDKSPSQVHRMLNSLTDKELIKYRRELMDNGRPPGFYKLNVSEITIKINENGVSIQLKYVNEKKRDKLITFPTVKKE